MQTHWNSRYNQTDQTQLGWYESDPQPSLTLIQNCKIPKSELILDVGSGSSVLIDRLVEAGYAQIIATDISSDALVITQDRLGNRANPVQFIVDDITQPHALLNLQNVAIWHDRAVLHFLTQESEQKTYLNTLKTVLKPGGFVIIATFAIGGVTKCAGLPVWQYSLEMLVQFLGDDFELVTSLNHLYHTTWGQERPFIYGVFQKK